MPQVFEEMVSGHLDTLYRGALFLTGGRAERASELLVVAVRDAFRASREGGADGSVALLDQSLARAFLRDHPPTGMAAPDVGVPEPDPEALNGTVSDDLHRASARVPPPARPALWLVLLRRWRWADAADALGVGQAVFEQLLAHRATLLAALASGRARSRKRANGLGG